MANRSSPSVYGAGPISGQSYEGATDWRKYAEQEFTKDGIVFFSPMRAKEYLAKEQVLRGDPDAYTDLGLSNPKGIVTRDRFDCTTADLILMNLLPAEDQMEADRERARILLNEARTFAQHDMVGPIVVHPQELLDLIDRLAGRGNSSLGTMIEMGWADGARVPIVVVMTQKNPHYHAMVTEIGGYVVETLDSGIAMAKAILLPGQRASDAYQQTGFAHVERKTLAGEPFTSE